MHVNMSYDDDLFDDLFDDDDDRTDDYDSDDGYDEPAPKRRPQNSKRAPKRAPARSSSDDNDDDDYDYDYDDRPRRRPKQGGGKQSKQSKQGKSKSKPTLKHTLKLVPVWFKATVAAVVTVVLILATLTGLIVGHNSGKSANAVKTPVAVKGQSPLLDNLESLKDAQIQSLTNKLKSVQAASTLNTTDDSLYLLLSKHAAEDTPNVDEILTRLYAMQPAADQSAIEAVRSDIAKFMTDDAASTVAYDMVTGTTPAKHVKAAGKKSSQSILIPYVYNKQQALYVVFTPFTTNKATYMTVSIAGVESKSHKVYYYKYIGCISEAGVNAFTESMKAGTDAASQYTKSSSSGAASAPKVPEADAGGIAPAPGHGEVPEGLPSLEP